MKKIEKRRCLSLEDRQCIWMMRSRGYGIREIGRWLRKNPSVVSRELKRNSLPVYVAAGLTPLERASEADAKARRRRQEKRRGKRKAKQIASVYEHIAKKLSDKFSPEMIAHTIGQSLPGVKISTSSIYRMIKHAGPEMIKYLPEGGKKRRRRVTNRRGKFQVRVMEKRHKDERPTAAEDRMEIGHLEGDTIVGKRRSKGAILTICDRRARKLWFVKVADLKAGTIRKALVTLLLSLPIEARKTLTFDRGSEFADWHLLELIVKGLKVYFCTAYAPQEKGSVERGNREFRRYFPKGTDFSLVEADEVRRVTAAIDSRPMKCLNWQSPDQVYQKELEEQLLKAA